MTVINTNIKSLYTQAALRKSEADGKTAMEQMATGKRINSSKDDAGGMAIATRMTQQIKGMDQASRNAGDAVTLLQTVDGVSSQITNMLQRMSELAVQAGNDTYSTEQRGYADNEFQALKSEIGRLVTTSQWNNIQILDGSAGATGTLSFQIGPGSADTVTANLGNFTTLAVTPLATQDVTTGTKAQAAITAIDTVLKNINGNRATLGAVVNRLDSVINNLSTGSINLQASRSQIQDADYAKASTELARTQIMQQAGTAVLAQANTSMQTVLKLLQG
jgi:flagellin